MSNAKHTPGPLVQGGRGRAVNRATKTDRFFSEDGLWFPTLVIGGWVAIQWILTL